MLILTSGGDVNKQGKVCMRGETNVRGRAN